MAGELHLRDVPEAERPRERMFRSGEASLSNAELLAILLRSGTPQESVLVLAQRLLSEVGGLPGLANIRLEELMRLKGVGPAKATQVRAGIELGRRLSRALHTERYAVRAPEDAAAFLMEEMRYLVQEHFVCLFLNTKNHILAQETIFIGSLDASIVHPREVFQRAIQRNSASILCAHNHPSGDPSPSREDVEVTKRLHAAGQIVGIELLDHLVIGDGRFVSLKQRGLF